MTNAAFVRGLAAGLLACIACSGTDPPSLLDAVVASDASAVEAALDAGADPNTLSADGSPVLLLAASTGAEDVSALLIARGGDIEAVRSSPSLDGSNPIAPHSATALVAAAIGGHESLALRLLEDGADPTSASAHGITALHAAARNNLPALARDLLARHADADARTSAGFTPLLSACYNEATEIPVLLLDAGADIGATSNVGYPALFYASQNDHIEIVKLLIERGADLHQTYPRGYTARSRAAALGHVEIVRLLMRHGAS